MPDRVDPGLSETERAILACGLVEWGGPASPTDALAHLLGFADKQALFDEGRAIAHALRSGEPITPVEWRRALMATEIVFASDLVGSGIDWSSTTGFTDEETIRALRSAQRKLARVARSTR